MYRYLSLECTGTCHWNVQVQHHRSQAVQVMSGFFPLCQSALISLAASRLRRTLYFTRRSTPFFSSHPLGIMKLLRFSFQARCNRSTQTNISGALVALAASAAHHKGTLANKSSFLRLRGAMPVSKVSTSIRLPCAYTYFVMPPFRPPRALPPEARS